MSLLGIDVGTTGCKAAVFSLEGELLASAYQEYDFRAPQPGWAELDAPVIWDTITHTVRDAIHRSSGDPIRALAVASMGEAVVPVTADRQILGPSIMNFDVRGQEYVDDLGAALDNTRLYRINGNTFGNHYSLTKLKWIKDCQSDLYARSYKFLHWSSFVAFMLGAEPVLDYSLANRSLLFDLERGAWSDELLAWAGLDREKLPDTMPSGQVIATVSRQAADMLGLPAGVAIVTGAHDQCATAVGCGVIQPGSAVFGMGTFLCITPVFRERRVPAMMIERGLNTEHHAIPGQYVSFIYNQGGSHVKWFRDTFAAAEAREAAARSASIYPALFAEIPEDMSSVIVLPHFTVTGPPAFIADSCGVIAGLHLDTSRGDILKGIIEGNCFALKEVVDTLPPTGISITDYRATGGGSRSDAWVQTCADIMGTPLVRPSITEAGTLGAAIIAGVGCGAFSSYSDGVQAMVRPDRSFEPDRHRHARYAGRYESFKQLWPLLQDYLRGHAGREGQ